MQRLQVVLGHLTGRRGSGWMPQAAPCLSGSPQASAADVVVVHGRRTAICRAGRGGFKDTTPDELLSAVMTAVLKDVNLRPEELGDICVVTSQRLCLCPLSIDSVHRGCRQWPA
uniref:acetyl-CoA C-acetyltransferase n=1 Tax=Colobus angolensis palliatus TaxID=336983 RepID=A0A2K5HGI9_COLAP